MSEELHTATAERADLKHRIEAGNEHLLEAHAEHIKDLQQESAKGEAAHDKLAEIAPQAAVEQGISGNAVEDFQKAQAAEASANQSTPLQPSSFELKTATRRGLKEVRRQLPTADRALSKVIHQPVIRAISDAADKSISRPSGLLGGGLVAFIGSTGYLLLAKHIGFTYNYFVVVALFIVGFAFGLVLELIVWSLTSARRQRNQ